MSTAAYDTAYHLRVVSDAYQKVQEEMQPCPVCFTFVHPNNYEKHMERHSTQLEIVQKPLFDYAALDTETRIVVQQEDKEFDRNMNDAGASFIRACHNLQRIHKALLYKRPGFIDYLKTKSGLGERTAYRMIDVAKKFDNLANISAAPSALYLLAAPSTPEEAVNEALERAENGETITHSAAKAIVNEHKNGATPELEPTEDDTEPAQPLQVVWEREPLHVVDKPDLAVIGVPDYLHSAVKLGDVSLRQAQKVADTLKDVSPEIAAAAAVHRISDPQLIQLLHDKRDTDTAKSALASGYLQDGEPENDKPLSAASAWDFQGLLRKGEREHREASRDKRIEGKLAQIRNAPEGVFSVVYADPAWQYDNSGLHGAAERHYPTMPTPDICTLLERIELQISDDAVLFMWATNPLLVDAMQVISAWKFNYKTNFVWVKDKPTTGLGFYVKGRHELLMIATRGSFLPLFIPDSVIDVAKGEHSKKPEGVRALIEAMYPNQRYIELFARGTDPRENWTFWGAEA
jgi:N6-adenosine-specific RNA methylase IME4